MKLYLSSYRIPAQEDFYELLGKRDEISAAFLTNAKDYRDYARKEAKIQSWQEYLKKLGVATTAVDLRDYTSTESIFNKLKDYDLIYALGGNTFNLRQAMKVSGFDTAIKDLLANGVVYAGESAGAIVLGRTLRGFETMDSLEEVRGEVVWEGLGLVNRVIVPHADSTDYKDRVKPMTTTYPDAIVLNDNQVFIVNGEKTKIVTGVQQ